MSVYTPSALSVAGLEFQVVDRIDTEDRLPYTWRPYREFVEKVVVRQAEVGGTSRPDKISRPDEVEWTLDDWSGGEGQKYIDSSKKSTWKQYWYSTAAVDVRTNGQLALGYRVVDDSAGFGAVTDGPFLQVCNGFLAAFAYDNAASASRSVRKSLATGVYSALADGTTAAITRIAGLPPVRGTAAYVCHGAGASCNVSQIDVNGNAAVSATGTIGNARGAMIVDGRIYVLKAQGSGVTANHVLLQTPAITTTASAYPMTATTIATLDGASGVTGWAWLGKKLFIITQGTDEEPWVHLWNGEVLEDRAKLPIGFRMKSAFPAYPGATMLGDVLFAVGYREGASGQPEVPMITYLSGGRSATVGVIRDDPDISTTSTRALSCAGGFQNELVVGTNQGQAYIYDIADGGLSQLFSGFTAGDDITSIEYVRGQYYFSTLNGTTAKVYATQATGNNKYPASAIVRGSTWDFNYRDIKKLITKVEVHTQPLPAGSSVGLSLVFDDGTTVTTDVNGAALTHSGTGATRTVFTISGVDAGGTSVARTGVTLRVDQTLTAGTNSATTPVVRAIHVRGLTHAWVRFIEATVDLSDDVPGQVSLPTPSTGEQKATNMRTLLTTQPSPPIQVKLHYRSGNLDGIPQTLDTALTCILEDWEQILTHKGNGFGRIVLRVLT